MLPIVAVSESVVWRTTVANALQPRGCTVFTAAGTVDAVRFLFDNPRSLVVVSTDLGEAGVNVTSTLIRENCGSLPMLVLVGDTRGFMRPEATTRLHYQDWVPDAYDYDAIQRLAGGPSRPTVTTSEIAAVEMTMRAAEIIAPPKPAAAWDPSITGDELELVLKRLRDSDYFDALGVSRDADDDEAEAAWQRLAGRYAESNVPPEVARSNAETLREILATLQDCRLVLTNSATRDLYRRALEANRRYTG